MRDRCELHPALSELKIDQFRGVEPAGLVFKVGKSTKHGDDGTEATALEMADVILFESLNTS
jgi:hypothetical protein